MRLQTNIGMLFLRNGQEYVSKKDKRFLPHKVCVCVLGAVLKGWVNNYIKQFG